MSDNICALATGHGKGAISIIRTSGESVIEDFSKIFDVKHFDTTPANKIRFGSIYDGDDVIDDVLVALFRAPHSYTGENSVEIYCHGSSYIVSKILDLLINNGFRLAAPGEFSKRAFLNGKMDLAQTEAVADLISSESLASHDVAMRQMKGGYSAELKQMRSKMLDIVSLLELELDFSDEEVEFADRKMLYKLLSDVRFKVDSLASSFSLGNIIKNGVPVAIIGATNTGKSTLLNAIYGEERALVSNIPGTTRDSIEEVVNINGVLFRFIDTAGLRETSDVVEKLGIERSYLKLRDASVVVLLLDSSNPQTFETDLNLLKSHIDLSRQKLLIALNKVDLICPNSLVLTDLIYSNNSSFDSLPFIGEYFDKIISSFNSIFTGSPTPIIIGISAKLMTGVNTLKNLLYSISSSDIDFKSNTVVTNKRHYQALVTARDALDRSITAIDNDIPSDLVAEDMRDAINEIGEIVGEITNNEVLGNIFKNFCIGK